MERNENITKSRIRERLNTLHMTQRELARKIEKTETTVSRWINGNRVPLATDFISLSRALECTCDYLLGLSDDPQKTSR